MLRQPSSTPDPIAVLQALGLSDADDVTPWLGGADTAIWRVMHGGEAYALRLFRAGQEARCEREVAAMEAARTGGVPVPEVHAAETWQQRPALLLSWCPGRPLLHYLLRQPWLARTFGVTFGEMQAAIHAISAPEVLERSGVSWIDRIGADEDALRVRLQELPSKRNVLLHLDYHPLNVLSDGKHITGVLDWANTHAGDPRIDVARTRTILRLDMGRPERSRLLNALIEPLWLAFEQGWWAGYRAAAGSADDMALFYAAAGALMERDLAHRYTPLQLAGVSRWTRRWKEQAGFSA
jgi:aminoglycoside phosphotransferase (APT) family kinase protein